MLTLCFEAQGHPPLELPVRHSEWMRRNLAREAARPAMHGALAKDAAVARAVQVRPFITPPPGPLPHLLSSPSLRRWRAPCRCACLAPTYSLSSPYLGPI